MNTTSKELRYKLPAQFQKENLNSAKAWAVIISGRVSKIVFMSDCPKNKKFADFRNESKFMLYGFGKVVSGYVVYFPELNENYFCRLTDGDKSWY